MPITVSIIMPSYNCAEFIDVTIQSVLAQTLTDFELLIIDDCSTDNTCDVVGKYLLDERVKLLCLERNSGSALARNAAIEQAKGRYIAFLDADDIWHPQKLAIQIAAMKKNNWILTYTEYNLIDQYGEQRGDSGRLKASINYTGLLEGCIMQNSTVIYDSCLLGQKMYCPPLRKRQDYALFLSIIKITGSAYLVPSPTFTWLCSYRLRPNSVSSNKVKNIPLQWSVYKDIEKLNLIACCYYMVRWFFYASLKNIKRKLLVS